MAIGPQNRVLGSDYTVKFGFSGHETIMELDKFTFKASDEKKEFMPAGYTMPRYQLVHNGFDLTFEGGVINDDLQKIFQSIYDHNLNSKGGLGTTPRGGNTTVDVTWTLSFPEIDGNSIVIVFREVTLSEMNIDYGGQAEEIKQTFNGKSKYAEIIQMPLVDGATVTAVGIIGTIINNGNINSARG